MNPFVNAFLAALYIVGIVFVIQTFTSIKALHDTLLIPIGMLGLFVLSAATMGLLFVYKPLELLFDAKKREAFLFFIKTVLTFAALILAYITALSLIVSP